MYVYTKNKYKYINYIWELQIYVQLSWILRGPYSLSLYTQRI